MRNRAIRNCAVTRVLVIIALGLLFAVASGSARAGTTERISIASDGVWGNGNSRFPSISADGRFVAFTSNAKNLVESDTNGTNDIFVHDRQTGQTTRVSVASDGTQGNGTSHAASISSDGRFVAFNSRATNLVDGDTNVVSHIFVHDRQTGQTTRVSVASDGTQGNDHSHVPSINADGRFVAFISYATNLVEGDTNEKGDIFVHDRQTGETIRISLASDGTQGNGRSDRPSISSDGHFVAFISYASNLVADDTNGQQDIFVHDRQTGETTRVSLTSEGTEVNSSSDSPSISTDGRFVVFSSNASNLVESDWNRVQDVFIHDRQTGQTTRVSISSDGIQGNSDSYYSSISGDGRFVAFASVAKNLVADDTNERWDIFVHDRQTSETTSVSVSSDGVQGNDHSQRPSISADGRFVAFESDAENLVKGYTNNFWDVFVHDRGVTLTITTTGSGEGSVGLSLPGGVYEEGTTVILTPQPSPGSFFVHWEGDLTGSDNPATILMDGDKSVVVYFIYPQLSVLSAPIGGVAITGSRTGTTPYTADCDLSEVIILTAPESVSVSGKTYYFELWFVNNVSVLPSEGRPFNEVKVTMDDRRTVLAQYGWRLPGDYNDDCTVNILDLLFVRNRLQTTCSE